MIKINLATRKQSSVAASGKAAAASSALGKMDLSMMKDLPIRKILIPLIVGFLADYLWETHQIEELAKLDVVIQKISGEQSKLKTELAKTKDFEKVKKALDDDEFTIKTKIDTIRTLVADRNSSPRLLIGLSNAIPGEVWLSAFKLENSVFSIRGTSLGFNQISDLMKSLNESAFYTDLRLKTTQQTRDEALEVEVATFELEARRR